MLFGGNLIVQVSYVIS